MKRISLLLAAACLVSFATASDQIRDVQTMLKSQGFYYGETDGNEGPETGAAIRRFQIRNGLKVTGKLDSETLQALGVGEKGTPVPVQPAPPQFNPRVSPAPPARVIPAPETPPPTPPGRDLVRDPKPEEITPQPAPRVIQDDPAVLQPPREIPAPVYTPFSTLFQGTPYEDAPREVQLDTLRRAQSYLASRRFYRGAVDGIPGPATSEALINYQESYRLRGTGRLDLDTLATMRLLPRTQPGGAPLQPFFNPNRRHGSSATWGFWIR